MPSFDVVSQLDLQEVDNALNQARKEVLQRYDFKDTGTVIDWDRKEKISIESKDDFKVNAVDDVLREKLARRHVSLKAVEFGNVAPGPGGRAKQEITLKQGIDSDRAREIATAVHQPIVDELRARGTPFHGVLYAGLMMTPSGPRVLEYNCRFGDPETQAVLPRLRSDLLELLERSSRSGGLADVTPEWSPQWAVTVVLASRGYPESSSKGDAIEGLESIDGLHCEVLHAGTAQREDGRIVTAGGRVLNVTGLGESPAEARERAYAAAEKIEFDGKQMRHDIAARAVERAEVA